MQHFEFVDPDETIAEHCAMPAWIPTSRDVRQFATLWREIQDLPRHLGQHSGGMVVCQGRLDEVVPLENASMPGRVVVQWDKDDCADLGIVKVDLLGLGMMAVLEEAITIMNGRFDSAQLAGLNRRRDRSRASAAGRPGRLSDVAAGGHGRRVSDGITRADGDAAAHEAGAVLRSRRRGRHHPSRAHRRQDGASVSGAAAWHRSR